MAQFPKTEADISALAMSMMSGYGAHAADFPSADIAVYQQRLAPMLAAKMPKLMRWLLHKLLLRLRT
ncbi:MAG: hypothetical protein ACYS9Y_09375 [Planctomycetota bacterium]|jgi:hypothetical protein